jgi:hypothetical protein
MENLLKISLIVFAFGLSNNIFSQEIKKNILQEPVKKKTSYDSKNNRPLKKEKLQDTKIQPKKAIRPEIKIQAK